MLSIHRHLLGRCLITICLHLQCVGAWFQILKLKQEKASSSEYAMDERLKRIQAKLFAYLAPLPKVLSAYPLSDNSVAGKMAHAVYYMRQKNLNTALKYANELISQEPKNPYFTEIKAQALFESGNIREAIQAYHQTLNLMPQSDLFKLSYAEAVLAGEPNRKTLEDLIVLLEHANRNHNHPLAYLYLGRVYSNMGDEATANYFAAEYNNAIGETDLARKMLQKALKMPLRPEIKLRANDLNEKLKQDQKRNSLF